MISAILANPQTYSDSDHLVPRKTSSMPFLQCSFSFQRAARRKHKSINQLMRMAINSQERKALNVMKNHFRPKKCSSGQISVVMSPTDRKIRALLEKASSSCDPPLVEEAFQLVRKLSVADSGAAPDPGKGYGSPELAVLVAEVAVELSAPDRTEDTAQQHRKAMTEIADEASKLFRSLSQANNQVPLP